MNKNKRIIIATHGRLAEGYVSALKIIVGDIPNLSYVNCYLDSDFNLNQTIEKMMEDISFENETLIICTDMMGGSVNNGFIPYLKRYPFQLITNINLAFLVDLVLSPETIDESLLIDKVSDSLVSVKYVNSCLKDMDDTDDF